MNFQSFYGVLMFVLAAGMLIFTLARRRSWPLHKLLFALLATYMGLSHERFLLLVDVVLSHAGDRTGRPGVRAYDAKRDNKRGLNVAFIAGSYIFAVLHISSSAKLHAAEEVQYFPVSALPLWRVIAHIVIF